MLNAAALAATVPELPGRSMKLTLTTRLDPSFGRTAGTLTSSHTLSLGSTPMLKQRGGVKRSASGAARPGGLRSATSEAPRARALPARPHLTGPGLQRAVAAGSLPYGRVMAATLSRYAAAVQEFFDWMAGLHIKPGDEIALDQAMTNYFDVLFADAQHPFVGKYVLWGYLLLYPDARRHDRDRLVLARAALHAWCRRVPGSSRHPLPLSVFYLVAEYFVKIDRVDAAIATLLMVESYARPSEIVNLAVQSVICPSSGRRGPRQWGILIGNADLKEFTKTGQSDDTVILGTSDRRWIVTVFALWHAKQVRAKADRVFPQLSLQSLEALFRKAHTQLCLNKLRVTPHVCRHSGPSHDVLNKIRSISEVQARGRWLSPKSCRRYEKSGRLLLQYARLDPRVARRAAIAETSLERLLTDILKPPRSSSTLTA